MRFAFMILAASLALSCGGESSAPEEDASCREPVSPPPLLYDTEQANRSAPTCKFQAGDLATTTIGAAIPPMPLKHVVVLMMENRSFDHLFSGLDPAKADVKRNGNNPDPSQRDKDSKLPVSITQSRKQTLCEPSPNHEWGPTHLQFNNCALDGFVAASNPNGARVMEYYTEEDIPFYYWLARTFAISDRNFGSLLGPTWPNRLFLIAGTSCGWAEAVDTNEGIEDCAALKARNIFNQLDDASIPFKIFLSVLDYGIPVDSMVADIGAYDNPWVYSTVEDFRSQAAGNSLPDVSFIEPNYESYTVRFGGAPNDDHPPANIQRGQLLIWEVVSALMSNPETWSSSALFITYDENGGYYDHVIPPSACDPAGDAAIPDYGFDRYGFRVPLLVVSPYARQGYVSHYITDHTSILRFIQAWKNLGALTARDANAWPMLDMFDFTAPPMAAPEISLLKPVIDFAREATCPEK